MSETVKRDARCDEPKSETVDNATASEVSMLIEEALPWIMLLIALAAAYRPGKP